MGYRVRSRPEWAWKHSGAASLGRPATYPAAPLLLVVRWGPCGHKRVRRPHGFRGWRRWFKPCRRLDFDLRVPVDTRSRRDQVPDDDVLLEPQQVVLGALDGRVSQHPR